MQNAEPLPSCPRESWTKRFRETDRHIELWRDCSPASTGADLKNYLAPVAQKSPLDSIRKGGDFYGGQSVNMQELEHGQGQIFYQYNPADYERHGALYENVVPVGTMAWSVPFTSPAINAGDGFSQGFNVKTGHSDVQKMLNANVRPKELNGECYTRAQAAVSVDSLNAGYGTKMEEIPRSHASTTPSLQWSSVMFAKEVVEDSPRVASDEELPRAFTGRTDEREQPLPSEHKRTSSAIEEGEQAGPSKRIRTSDAPLKVQVRREKLGERVTALQQLVSPFGKTDTASVLLEAIGYIKFLQDQVQVLSSPYLKGLPSIQNQDGAGGDSKVSDLSSRGLCLMPISSTRLVANDNGADFWASGVGGGTRF